MISSSVKQDHVRNVFSNLQHIRIKNSHSLSPTQRPYTVQPDGWHSTQQRPSLHHANSEPPVTACVCWAWAGRRWVGGGVCHLHRLWIRDLKEIDRLWLELCKCGLQGSVAAWLLHWRSTAKMWKENTTVHECPGSIMRTWSPISSHGDAKGRQTWILKKDTETPILASVTPNLLGTVRAVRAVCAGVATITAAHHPKRTTGTWQLERVIWSPSPRPKFCIICKPNPAKGTPTGTSTAANDVQTAECTSRERVTRTHRGCVYCC